MKKADIILALISGEGVAWIAYSLLKGAEVESILGIAISSLLWTLFIIFPILSLFGLWIGYLIGKKYLFVFQVAKFLLIGVLAVLVDLGVLNVLMSLFGIAAGWGFVLFKAVSFIVATFSKFWGNKFWAFERAETKKMGRELLQFYVVTLVGMAVNVGVASFVVNSVGPQFGLNLQVWANIGAIVAAVAGAAWNFLGYKFVVFKT
jgi:putative flippase GtrA